ncbi:hypothetical protein PFISCL1PPCAC_25785, partial [Pristionchus fissidentatus]
GPVDELQAQSWYAAGFFSSDIRFQISFNDEFDPNDRIFTLGELMNLNCRTLPFFFSTDVQNDKKEQEELLNTLLQEVESIRVSCNEKISSSRAEDRETIDALRNQVAALVESHSSLRSRLDSISAQKGNGGANTKEMEKKVNELKKKVDEQEKNQSAMRKELSTVTSKCDRNNTKLNALLEKQKTAESTNDGFDRRISDLKNSEKSIRDSIKSCEETAASSSAQLESIKTDLGEIRTQMERDRKESCLDRSELDTVKRELSDVKGEIEKEREDHVHRVAMSEEKLRSEMKSMEEKREKNGEQSLRPEQTTQLQQPSKVVESEREPWATEEAVVNGVEEAATDSIPPWETATQTVGKSESAPWDSTEKVNKIETVQVQAVVGTVKEAVKPISRGKNWDAICRELSDDEEELSSRKENVAQTKPINDSDVSLVADFIFILRAYVAALTGDDLNSLREEDGQPISRVRAVMPHLSQSVAVFDPTDDLLLREIPLITRVNMLRCGVCPMRMYTPVNLVDHLTDQQHLKAMHDKAYLPVVGVYATVVEQILRRLADRFGIKRPAAREEELLKKGRRTFKKLQDPSKCRPTNEFNPQFVMDVMFNADRQREVLESIREYISQEPTKSQFLERCARTSPPGLRTAASVVWRTTRRTTTTST